MKNKQHRLDEIARQIIADKVCPELAARAHHLVFGEGSPEAPVVFIGEAPGRNEDEQGRPFIGAAGKFLDELLDGAGLKREDVYITSILKYRPPNNRDPRPDEKAAFWPYLQAQLEVIRPKLVATLGSHSTNCFLPGVRIGQVHGQLTPVSLGNETINLLPLYHPAAVLYNRSMRQTLIADFSRIPDILQKL